MNSKGNPILAVDAIIRVPGGRVVLIMRKYEPHGWALPGGVVDEGESCEHAVVREAKEETGLDVRIVRQLGTYSDPARDPRKHVVSVVFVCEVVGGELRAADDAVNAHTFSRADVEANRDKLCFDHATILDDYYRQGQTVDESRVFRFAGPVEYVKLDFRVEDGEVRFEAGLKEEKS